MKRTLDAYQLAQERSYKKQARALADLSAQEAASVLMSYEDLETAASILTHLTSDVQGDLLQALSPEDRSKLLPVWDRIETSKQGSNGRGRRD